MNNWTEFFFLCGSSAAGLTGLMFIAITFGSRLITKERLSYVEAFFSPIAYHFIQVFVLCCVALVPTAGPKILGSSILITTAWRLAQLVNTYRVTGLASSDTGEVDRSDWIVGIFLPGAVYVLLIVTGVLELIGSAAATSLLAASLIFLLIIALRRAWDMLIWVATKVD